MGVGVGVICASNVVGFTMIVMGVRVIMLVVVVGAGVTVPVVLV